MLTTNLNYQSNSALYSGFFKQIYAYYTSCGYHLSIEDETSSIIKFSILKENEYYQAVFIRTINPSNDVIMDGFHELPHDETNNSATLLFTNTEGIDDKLEPYRHFNTVFVSKAKLRTLQGLKNEIGPDYQHIQLHAHNDLAYDEFVKQGHVKSALVRATGTGKSYLIARISQDFLHHKISIFAPNRFILEQQQNIINTPNISFHTYQSTLSGNEDFELPKGTSAVFLDEFHRLGAHKWNKTLTKAIDKDNIALIGTSATHIRHLDSKRNMADEIFDSNIVAPLTLAQSIGLNILPEPHYISTLYEINESVAHLRNVINRIKILPSKKEAFLNTLKGIEVSWDKSNGIADIIAYHIPDMSGNYVVFCENIAHMKKIKRNMTAWAKEASTLLGIPNTRVNTYEVSSQQTNKQNKANLSTFETKTSDLNLLFVVDILNEGKHIANIDGLFLFRKTLSPNIYYQQIGRCLSAKHDKAPIIFDFVSNINNLKDVSLRDDVEAERLAYNNLRTNAGLSPIVLETNIAHQLEHFKQRMLDLEDEVKSTSFEFSAAFSLLREYKKEYGHLLISRNDVYQEAQIGYFVSKIRQMNTDDKLTEAQRQKLDSVDFPYHYMPYAMEMYLNSVEKFYHQYGHTNITQHDTYEGMQLGRWVSRLRSDTSYRDNLSQEQLQRLTNIHFIFDLGVHRETLFINELIAYKNEHGNCDIPFKYETKSGYKLGHQCSSKRKAYQQNALNKAFIQKIQATGFVLELKEKWFEDRFVLLKDFYETHKHLQLPFDHTVSNINLYAFIGQCRRRLKKMDSVSKETQHIWQEQLSRLSDIGFTETATDSKQIKTLIEYLEYVNDTEAKGKVPQTNSIYARLSRIRDDIHSNAANKSVVTFFEQHKLNESHFFRTRNDSYDLAFSEIVMFFENNGHLRITTGYQSDKLNLPSFISRLRKSIADGAPLLNEEQMTYLYKNGFSADPRKESRDKNLKLVINHIDANEDTKIKKKDKAAYQAFQSLKLAYERGIITEEYIQPLIDKKVMIKI